MRYNIIFTPCDPDYGSYMLVKGASRDEAIDFLSFQGIDMPLDTSIMVRGVYFNEATGKEIEGFWDIEFAKGK